ncbi:hypothetical protein BH11ACT4_BH11ACT4_16630 [soil metagenome]
MSKYDPLWKAIEGRDDPSFRLTFDEIDAILGFELDHSFLNYKKELLGRGYRVDKISLKNRTVDFVRE